VANRLASPPVAFAVPPPARASHSHRSSRAR
jgi:hypothetical protein